MKNQEIIILVAVAIVAIVAIVSTPSPTGKFISSRSADYTSYAVTSCHEIGGPFNFQFKPLSIRSKTKSMIFGCNHLSAEGEMICIEKSYTNNGDWNIKYFKVGCYDDEVYEEEITEDVMIKHFGYEYERLTNIQLEKPANSPRGY